MKCSLGISNFLKVISSLSHSVVFLYFFALITEEGFLISSCYSLELCIQMLVSFLFIIGDWNAKLGSQEAPGVTGKFGLGVQNEAGQRLIQFCQGNTLVIANTLFQHTKEDFTHGHHQMVNTEIRLIIFFAAKDGEALSAKTRRGADCGSDHEFLIAKFRHKLKKVGKTIRPFRYDLNQISWDYTMEMTDSRD